MANIVLIALVPVFFPKIGRIEKGKTVEVSEEDAAPYIRDGHVVPASAEQGASEAEKSLTDASTLEQLKAAWEVEMGPGEYLDLFPDGPHADLALRILEKEADAKDSQ